jgi:hypothetical protein
LSFKPKIVLLGMMTKMPVAGVVWQTMQYVVGFQRLGFDVYYVEAHARTPSMLMQSDDDDSSLLAAQFIDGAMSRFDLDDKWAFHALHDDGRCYGLSDTRLKQLYRDAALLINLHGGTTPLPEHYATGRLVYLETDPVQLQIELHDNLQASLDFLAPHCAFFTFGENYGRPGCKLPVCSRFAFKPTRQPVIVDWWQTHAPGEPSSGDPMVGDATVWTTIGNWRQDQRPVQLNGEVYHWSKHFEFLKFLDLPRRSRETFELALSSYNDADERLLRECGWRVRPALSFSFDLDGYRRYITHSRGEFTVAKDQNVRLRTGWFSDRSATYLAAGRPVITQETGFSAILPTGEGLFGFATLDDITGALEQISSHYERHRKAALELARDYFSHEAVLRPLLAECGLESLRPTTKTSKSTPTSGHSMQESSIKRLNWGCGASGEPGWINSDQKDGPGINLSCDIRQGLPLETGSIDYVASIHALPEVPYAELVPVLEELRRVLKPGGILRLALPDLEKGIQAYLRGDKDYFLIPDDDMKSLGGKLVLQLIWYGYSRTLFTYDFIHEILMKAGFQQVTRCGYRESKGPHPEIVELDNREAESLFVEAVKCANGNNR